MALTCQIEQTPTCHLLRLAGQADVSAMPDLEQALTRLIATRPKAVVVDLTQMSFISSLGIGTLLNLHKAITRHGGRIRCVAPQPMVAEAFRRVRLYDVLDIRDSLDSALDFAPG